MSGQRRHGRLVRFPEYVDFLAESRRLGALRYIAQWRDFPVGSRVGNPPEARNLRQIRRSVLKSSRVKNVVVEEAIRRKCAEKEVRDEAAAILDEMAHTYSLYNVRALGLVVVSAMQKLFDGIYLNEEALKDLRQRSRSDPVVFMPSHKTYFDFLILSLLCFHCQIQLPAIAAGQDFMQMKLMGEVLRRSGAFFMRRSFGTDKLYWAVFTEYVQSNIVNNDRTMEFFVEATRSRVGKSLNPKYGLLQIVLEPYLRGSVFDIVIVPVSMNYDKILEEKLYAYELLGFPKPKESTSGLLKAREILYKNNGNCFVTFGEPISVRQYFGTTLHRSAFVCQPDSQFELDVQAKKEIKKFAHKIVELHNKNAVITVWSVAAMTILEMLNADDLAPFSYSWLHTRVHELVALLARLGTVVNVLKSLDHDLRYYLKIHEDLFEPFDVAAPAANIELRLLDQPVELTVGGVDKDVMERSISRLILTTYSNGMVHAVDSEGIICALVMGLDMHDVKEVKNEFCWLHTLMQREFVFVPGELDRIFDEALTILIDGRVLQFEDGLIRVARQNDAEMLAKLILPYFLNFQTVFDAVIRVEIPFKKPFDLIPTVQAYINARYLKQNAVRLSFLSTEPIKNAFHALSEEHIFRETESGQVVWREKLDGIQTRLRRLTKMLTDVRTNPSKL